LLSIYKIMITGQQLKTTFDYLKIAKPRGCLRALPIMGNSGITGE
jgi:hypothetical protein